MARVLSAITLNLAYTELDSGRRKAKLIADANEE